MRSLRKDAGWRISRNCFKMWNAAEKAAIWIMEHEKKLPAADSLHKKAGKCAEVVFSAPLRAFLR